MAGEPTPQREAIGRRGGSQLTWGSQPPHLTTVDKREVKLDRRLIAARATD
jgi:hypothetical protein